MQPSIEVRRDRAGRTLFDRAARAGHLRLFGRPMARWLRPLAPAAPVLLVLLASAAIASAQAFVSPELRAAAARLFQELAGIRGLPPPGAPPPLVIQSREERRRFVVAELGRKYSPARLDAESRALVAWGLVPPEFDLATFYADLLAEQAAAYYDPRAKRMVLANWLTPDLQRDALAHELVHALQDRLVDLDRFLAAVPDHGDEALARQALVEGEAVALSQDLGLRRNGRDFSALPDVADVARAIRSSATGPVLSRAPPFVRTMLTFPYASGVGFVHAFRQRHPWAALSAVYRDPPRSSAQILHPERYLDRREDPLPVVLPDLAPMLPPGSRALIEDELGEISLAEVLRRAPGEAANPLGWRGDRYALWDAPGGTSILIAVIVWENEDQAADFVRAYAPVLARKYGLGSIPPDGPLLTWSSVRTAFAIERRRRTVLVLEGVPATVLDRARAAVWSKPVVY
jgi:uncharacterized protein DUF955